MFDGRTFAAVLQPYIALSGLQAKLRLHFRTQANGLGCGSAAPSGLIIRLVTSAPPVSSRGYG